MATVLVVDDVPDNVRVLVECLKAENFRALVAQDGNAALQRARQARPDLILLDVMMPGLNGFETCMRLKAEEGTRDIPVIFLTALDDHTEKLKGFQAGAVDYLTKPFQFEEVIARVNTHLTLKRYEQELRDANQQLEARVRERTAELNAALEEVQNLRERLEAENAYLQKELGSGQRDIVGASVAIQSVLSDVAQVARTDTTVLVSGETGTGKELIARAIHEQSQRRDRALVMLNCAAISAGLVENELFGHVKGAYTGATERQIGRFELADGGTLFLDEVSELPLETQVKLLRVLQEREFEPVGSTKTIRADVRIVAATNRDLATEVAAGRFRSDLYYRLNVFPLRLPPLRDRREDIPMLVDHFVANLTRRLGRNIDRIEPVAIEKLCAHDWPGNIRELQNTIERAVVMATDGVLRLGWQLSSEAAAGASVASGTTAPAPFRDSPRTADSARLADIEREHIVNVLRQCRGVIEGPRGAAVRLGMKPSTARHRMRKLGIRKSDYLD